MANLPMLFEQHPLRAMSRLQRQIDRVFDDMFSGPGLPVFEAGFQPPVDVEETDTHYVLGFDLPGMKKEDIQLGIENGILTLRAERKDERTLGKGARSERFYGVIERSLSLPSNILPEGVEAQLENGVLHVAIPKAAQARPSQIQIGEGKPGFLSKLLGSEKKKEKAA